MKTKNLVLTLMATATISAVIFSGVRTINNSGNEYSELVLSNIEALSQGDNWDDDPTCWGPAFYGSVGQRSNTREIVVHFIDGGNGTKGLDKVCKEVYEECYALGSGKLEGTNSATNYELTDCEFRECKGDFGHTY